VVHAFANSKSYFSKYDTAAETAGKYLCMSLQAGYQLTRQQ